MDIIKINSKRLLLFAILAVFVVGICLSCVDAATFTCKGSKTKHVGNDQIIVDVCKIADSESGRSVRVISSQDSAEGGASHHKLDKVTVKYKVGKKSHTKTKKLGYNNDYIIKMPKGFKIVKITLKYHKATSKEFKKLKKNWPWT